MIWLNPWAWLGVLGVALPIAIHLLGRGHARVVRFPTLRFLDASRLLPTKRSRIEDPLLLAVRVAIVALAALALAQPLLLTSGRRRALDRGLARAVIVDTSASMRRRAVGGGTLVDSALAAGERLARDAQASIVVRSPDPARAIPAAVAWVAKQGRRGEIAIVSDFQRGAVDAVDLGRVPAALGIALRRVAANDSAKVARLAWITNERQLEARVTTTPTGTNVEWSPPANEQAVVVPVDLLAGPADAAALSALQTAASSAAVPLPIDSSHAIAVVFPRYPSRTALLPAIRPPRARWQLDLLAFVRRAALPVTAAGDATVDGKQRFVLVTDAPPLSLDAARLVSAARQATSSAPPPAELEPEALSDGELRAMERAPGAASTSQHRPLDDSGPSDGRWIWALVLALLIMEWWLRRSRPTAQAVTREHARAA
jgi:hypothetical protein